MSKRFGFKNASDALTGIIDEQKRIEYSSGDPEVVKFSGTSERLVDRINLITGNLPLFCLIGQDCPYWLQ